MIEWSSSSMCWSIHLEGIWLNMKKTLYFFIKLKCKKEKWGKKLFKSFLPHLYLLYIIIFNRPHNHKSREQNMKKLSWVWNYETLKPYSTLSFWESLERYTQDHNFWKRKEMNSIFSKNKNSSITFWYDLHIPFLHPSLNLWRHICRVWSVTTFWNSDTHENWLVFQWEIHIFDYISKD